MMDSLRSRPFALPAALAALGLSLAACGGASAAAPTNLTAVRGNFASGQITNVSGATITLRGPGGNNAVTTTGSTRITKQQSGTAHDLTMGACITARGTESGGIVNAISVTVTTSTKGTCIAPLDGGFGGLRPRASGFPGFGGFGSYRTSGKITSAASDYAVVQTGAGATVRVNFSNATPITKVVALTTANLKVGECVTAVGHAQAGGSLSAITILASTAGPQGCAPAGRGFGGFRGGRGGFGGFGSGFDDGGGGGFDSGSPAGGSTV